MGTMQVIELEATDVYYFSAFDEAAFFEWLDKLSCVQKYEGSGNTLYITVSSDEVGENELRELLALFYRYRVAMRQLAAFDHPEFAEWFHDKRSYWHALVFGPVSNS